MNPKLIALYSEMSKLTRPKCDGCRAPRSCCSPEYCEMAEEFAAEQGVVLKRIGHERLPFMGPNGCIVPPHLRPACTLHVCSINAFGCDPKDPKFTEEYFKLRERIDFEESK